MLKSSKGKTVNVVGYEFDCLPAHVRISAHDSGASVRVATQRAVGNLLSNEQLKHRRINDFKISVVVISDRKVGE